MQDGGKLCVNSLCRFYEIFTLSRRLYSNYVFSGLVNDSVPSMDRPSFDYRVTTDFWSEIYCTTNRWAGHHLEYRCIWRKHFLKSKLSYCTKSASHFQLGRLATSGDINPNPGSSVINKNSAKCLVCGRVLVKNDQVIICGSCCHHTHIKCSGLTPIELKQLQAHGNYFWSWPPC